MSQVSVPSSSVQRNSSNDLLASLAFCSLAVVVISGVACAALLSPAIGTSLMLIGVKMIAVSVGGGLIVGTAGTVGLIAARCIYVRRQISKKKQNPQQSVDEKMISSPISPKTPFPDLEQIQQMRRDVFGQVKEVRALREEISELVSENDLLLSEIIVGEQLTIYNAALTDVEKYHRAFLTHWNAYYQAVELVRENSKQQHLINDPLINDTAMKMVYPLLEKSKIEKLNLSLETFRYLIKTAITAKRTCIFDHSQ